MKTQKDVWMGLAMIAAGLTLNAVASQAQATNDTASKPGDKVFVGPQARDRAVTRTPARFHKSRRLEAQALSNLSKAQALPQDADLNRTLKNPYPSYNSPFIFETRRYRRDLDSIYMGVNRPGNDSQVYYGLYYF